jgi:hypothetical protein
VSLAAAVRRFTYFKLFGTYLLGNKMSVEFPSGSRCLITQKQSHFWYQYGERIVFYFNHFLQFLKRKGTKFEK